MAKNTDYLEKKSLEYRKTVLEIIYNSGAGHTGAVSYTHLTLPTICSV